MCGARLCDAAGSTQVPSSGQGLPSWVSRKVGDLDMMRYPEGLVALCNDAGCGMSVHFAPLIASCR